MKMSRLHKIISSVILISILGFVFLYVFILPRLHMLPISKIVVKNLSNDPLKDLIVHYGKDQSYFLGDVQPKSSIEKELHFTGETEVSIGYMFQGRVILSDGIYVEPQSYLIDCVIDKQGKVEINATNPLIS